MLTTKQEKFVLNLFTGMSQRQAYVQAGYSSRQLPATLDRHAFDLANNGNVKTRLDGLKAEAKTARVMDAQERLERLSEIARGRITDYQEAGADGSGYISIGKESPNTAAIAGVESATKFDANGNTGTLFTKVKLHDPIKAIDVLNKMDKLYAENVVNIDNRTIIIKEVEVRLTGGDHKQLINGQ